MDTGSHLLFGITLAGLAYLDPVVAQNPVMAQAVMAATLVGSHAPDFDAAVRLKGYHAYLRYHRGVTHGIPALFVWPLGITGIVTPLFSLGWTESAHLYGWTLAAVVFHVLLDALNSYGVQCMRPFSRKWVHLDILPIFDWFLFLLHLTGVLLWGYTEWHPGLLFSLIYTLTLLYIGWRSWAHRRMVRLVEREWGSGCHCHVAPQFAWSTWRFVVELPDRFVTGVIKSGRIELEEVYSKEADLRLARATMGTDGVRAFLHFAQRIHVTCRELQDGYEVIWSDVRFSYKRTLPFGVHVRLDKNLRVVSQSLGWHKKLWDPPFV